MQLPRNYQSFRSLHRAPAVTCSMTGVQSTIAITTPQATLAIDISGIGPGRLSLRDNIIAAAPFWRPSLGTFRGIVSPAADGRNGGSVFQRRRLMQRSRLPEVSDSLPALRELHGVGLCSQSIRRRQAPLWTRPKLATCQARDHPCSSASSENRRMSRRTAW